jgi:hypothetical protein
MANPLVARSLWLQGPQVEEVRAGAERKDHVVITQLVGMAIEAVSRRHAPGLYIDRTDSAYERVDASQPGVEEFAVTMKSLSDAIELRNRIITHLEEANSECAAGERQRLLTFVVAGGGFAGVETLGAINDFIQEALPYYPSLRLEFVRTVLVTPDQVILPELSSKL